MDSKNKPRVCINACDDYDIANLKKIISAQLESLGGIDGLLKNGKNVVVKPNIVIRKTADAGATTNPAFLQAVCELFCEKGADVTVAESSGGLYNAATMGANYRVSGIAQAAQNAGAKLHDDFSGTMLYRDENKLCRSFNVLTPIANADVIVNLPKLKTHTIATMSCAVKNMYGVIPGIEKVELHSRFPDITDFADMLIDLNLTVPPAVSICDCIDVMEGNGPTAGTKTHIGAIMTSLSAFALDIAAASLAKIDFSLVKTVENADKRGILPASLDSIELYGDVQLESIAKKMRLPDTKDTRFETLSHIFGGRLKKWLSPRPKVIKSRCVGCGDCVKNCPRKLITIREKKAHIETNGCIHCFCCHELCRHGAVKIKKPFISGM